MWETLVLLFLLCLLNVGCIINTDYSQQLSEVEKLLKHNPDSALVVLNKNKDKIKQMPESYRMKFLLCLVDAQNKTISKLLPSKEIEVAVRYEERYGNATEQARAYYLLGSAYRDEGESPMALRCFQKSASLVESIRNKDNYHFLGCVYGQISDIFDLQYLSNMSLKYSAKAERYFLLAGDTASCATALARSLVSYQLLEKYNLSIKQGWKAITLYNYVNNVTDKGLTYGLLALSYIRVGKYKKAKFCLDEYRSKSGVYDKDGNIGKGHEIHYETLGEYYLGINKLDSAEYYFRKTLVAKEDDNCQEGGCRGLYLLYKKRGNKDSLAKYADLSYQICDKRILDLSSREVQNMQQLYNYNRNQKKAKQEQSRSEKLKFWVIGLSGGLFACVLMGVLYFNNEKAKRKVERIGYEKKLEKLLEAKQKQKLLSDNQIERMTKETNQQIADLTLQLKEYQKEKNLTDKQMKEDVVQASAICQKFHRAGAALTTLAKEDWEEVETLLFTEFPSFQLKLVAHKPNMALDDYQLCLLTRLSFAPYEIANVLNLKPSNVTMKRKRLLKMIFDEDGNAKLFDKYLQKLC